MADQKILTRAQDEGQTEAQLRRSLRPDEEISEERAAQLASRKWVTTYVYQKDWSDETKQAYVQAYVNEIVQSNPR